MLCILPSCVFCVLNLECRGVVLQVTPMHTVLQQTLVPATVTCDSLANMHRIYPYQAGYKTCYPVGKVNARVKSRKYRGQSPRLNIMQVIKRVSDQEWPGTVMGVNITQIQDGVLYRNKCKIICYDCCDAFDPLVLEQEHMMTRNENDTKWLEFIHA